MYGFHYAYQTPAILPAWYGYTSAIASVVFWVAVIASFYFFGRFLLLLGGSKESALEILRKRYAKGEIGKEEFESKKKDLDR